jgi:hypothetical protein
MTVKEMENIFFKETTITDLLLSLLPENAEYSKYIQQIVNNASEMENNKNE